MEQLQLPQGKMVVVPYVGPRPEATHVVVFSWRRDHLKEHDEMIGAVTCAWTDTTDHRRIENLKTRVYLALRTDWHRLQVDVRPLEHMLRERRTMDDLQRFKRKMGQVLRTYEAEKVKALRGELGLPELALERLDTELQLAWEKAERIYGKKKVEYYEPTN
jgi:hypothetical protein